MSGRARYICTPVTGTKARVLPVVGIGVALLMGSSMTASERVRTKRIDIVGDDGRTMLALSTDAHGGRLDVWTPQGRNIMRLAGNEHGGDLAVWSNDGITIGPLLIRDLRRSADEVGGHIVSA